MNFTSILLGFKTLVDSSPAKVVASLIRLDTTLREMVMNQAELKIALSKVEANQEATKEALAKVVVEVQTLITALANTNNTLDPAVEEAVNRLITTSGTNSDIAKQLDDMNANASAETLEVAGTPS